MSSSNSPVTALNSSEMRYSVGMLAGRRNTKFLAKEPSSSPLQSMANVSARYIEPAGFTSALITLRPPFCNQNTD